MARDRIVELLRIRADQLRPNPRNWRTHPPAQRAALQGILAEVGYVGALIARRLPDGAFELIDGHLRAETMPDAEVPVLIVNLNDAEAAKVLATLDPLAAMAETDDRQLRELLAQVYTEDEHVEQLLAELQRSVDLPRCEDVARELHIKECYQVVVECEDERQQQAVYERLVGEGHRCRLLIM